MTPVIDETHDPFLESWVESANQAACDFPLQNLPLGRFRCDGGQEWRIGVAIGDQVLDLRHAGLIGAERMEQLMAHSSVQRQALRRAIFSGLRRGSPQEDWLRASLLPQSQIQLGLPCHIGDYTDFYSGIHHATAVGKLFRPDNPLLPNYKWVPIGYHGRSSSINVSPSIFTRPTGQRRGIDDSQPDFGPSMRLDYELELGLIIGRPNAQGEPIPMSKAEEHLFGVVLLNDWSARDIQAWEYQPLGPFLAKNFASTLSPWIVTMEALAPFRGCFTRPAGDPMPLPYLDSVENRQSGAIHIQMEVWLQTNAMRAAGYAGDQLSSSGYHDAYWTAAQLVTHHTVNGCNLNSGDLFGTGTLSGPTPGGAGSLLEHSQGGKQAIRLSNGEERVFLEDGDTVILRGFCERAGAKRIGFGDCRGTVGPSFDGGFNRSMQQVG